MQILIESISKELEKKYICKKIFSWSNKTNFLEKIPILICQKLKAKVQCQYLK